MDITIYNGFTSKVFQGLDLTTLDIRVALFESGYTPAKQHTTFASIQDDEIIAEGYVSGGALLGTPGVSELMGQDAFALTGDDVSWNPSTITARVVVLYEGVSGDLICSFYLDADAISDNGVFEIQWPADGIIKVSQRVE